MASEFDPLGKYFFDEINESEASRLNAQYPFYKSVMGHPQVIPPGIDIAHISKVIDVATGTGSWAVDFASLPTVHDSDVQVFACDISSEKFLQGNKSPAKQMTFFQQDLTKPFPDELLGTFDLINLAFVSYALTSQGWEIALQNLYSLLRPGGHLVIRDGDLIIYDHEHPLPPEGQEPDAVAYMQGTSTVANMNRIIVGGALQRGLVVGLSYHLPEMCKAASLRVISSRRVEIPIGNYCDSFTGIDGTSLSKFKAVSIKNNVQVFNTVSIAMMKNGGIELANGAVILNEEERRVLMEDVARFVVNEGGSTVFFEYVVERPFES